MSATLTELNVYPLKSGRGTSLTTAELTVRGLRYDREFMLVTPEGRFLSQRELAPMALMHPSYDGEVLQVKAPGMVPLIHKAVDDGPVLEVTVHRHDCQGLDQGDEAASWFSSLLDRDCRLVRFTGHRATSRGGGEVMFADGYPLLVISAESLRSHEDTLRWITRNRGRGSCTVAMVKGSQVHLTAVADSGATFGGWDGACHGTDGCDLTLGGDTAVSASFSGGTDVDGIGGLRFQRQVFLNGHHFRSSVQRFHQLPGGPPRETEFQATLLREWS